MGTIQTDGFNKKEWINTTYGGMLELDIDDKNDLFVSDFITRIEYYMFYPNKAYYINISTSQKLHFNVERLSNGIALMMLSHNLLSDHMIECNGEETERKYFHILMQVREHI
jgi:hypothetical protein